MQELKIWIDMCIQILEIELNAFGYVFTLEQLFIYSTLGVIVLTALFKLFNT